MILVLSLALVACRPALDDPNATLAIPTSVPTYSAQRPSPGQRQLAVDLSAQATSLEAAPDPGKAIGLLTQALTQDPSNPQARLALARLFAKAGRSSVALKLLQPCGELLKSSGVCLELLQNVKRDTAFAHLRDTAQGQALLDPVPAAPLPYARWSALLAKALQNTDMVQLNSFVDPKVSFDLVRVCPNCANLAARNETRRPLIGLALAAKVAVRFDTQHSDAHGTPLLVPGEPTCLDHCCTYAVPDPVPEGKATLRRLCFWPQEPGQGRVTEMAFVYGPTETIR